MLMLKRAVDTSVLIGPIMWNDGSYSLITNTFSLCCTVTAVDIWSNTTKQDLNVQSAGVNEVLFLANGMCSIQLQASNLSNVGNFTVGWNYTSTVPGIAQFDVLQGEAWDAMYGSLASNTVMIKAGIVSIAINVLSSVVGITSMMIAVKSALSNTININNRITSLFITVQSTWSNTIALGVASSSLLSNVNASLNNQTSTMVAVRSTLSNSLALLIWEASISSSVLALSVTDTAQNVALVSILSNIAAITPADPAAIWSYAISQQSTVGMAAAYLMAAGAAADPWLTALPGGYSGSQAGAIIGSLESGASVASSVWGHEQALSLGVAVRSTWSNTIAIKASADNNGNAIEVLRINDVSMLIAVRSTWSNTIAIDVTATSTLANVKLYGASTMIGISSLLSNVNALNVLDSSMFVAVRSTWSNTLAILVAESSILSNVANVDSDVLAMQGNVTTILAGTTSIAINVSSLLSNVANVDSELVTVDGVVDSILVGTSSLLSNVNASLVATASLLSNVANVDADIVSALTVIPTNTMTRVLEGTMTVEQGVRIILAWAAGAVSLASTIRSFQSQDGATARISGNEDANGQRTGVVVDGS